VNLHRVTLTLAPAKAKRKRSGVSLAEANLILFW